LTIEVTCANALALPKISLIIMTPLHYDDLPKTVNECWELLGPENYPKAIAAFIPGS
jgi:hypothetical protein